METTKKEFLKQNRETIIKGIVSEVGKAGLKAAMEYIAYEISGDRFDDIVEEETYDFFNENQNAESICRKLVSVAVAMTRDQTEYWEWREEQKVRQAKACGLI